jgi:hypothetical protein
LVAAASICSLQALHGLVIAAGFYERVLDWILSLGGTKRKAEMRA